MATAFRINATTSRLDLVDIATGAGIDHGLLTGLGDDDHLQYLLLAGRAGGQSANGGIAAGEALQLFGTSNATKGPVRINDLAFTHSSGTLAMLQIGGTITTSGSTINFLEIAQVAGSPRTLNVTSAPVGRAVIFQPSIRNTTPGSAVDLGAWLLFANAAQFRTNNTVGETVAEVRTFSDGPTFNQITGGDITCAILTSLDCRPTISTGATVTTRRGVRFLNRSGAGTQTDVIGFDYEAQTAAGLNIAFRNQDSAASVRSAGPGIFGANQAPSQQLDVFGNLIILASPGASRLMFQEPTASGTMVTTWEAQTQAADINYVWPAAQGAANSVFKNNGAGVTSWQDTTTDWLSQYLLLAGRSGTNNNPVLSTTAAGILSGSTSASFGLALQANNTSAPRTARITTDMLSVFASSYTYPSGSAADFRPIIHNPAVSSIDVANPTLGFMVVTPTYTYTVAQSWGLAPKSGLQFNPEWISGGSLGAGSETGSLAAIQCRPKFNGTQGPRTLGNFHALLVQPEMTGSAGTCTAMQGITIQPVSPAGTTVTTSRGVYIQDANLAGTLGTETVGLDLEITKGTAGTNRIGIRSTSSGASLRWAGQARFGANSEPTNPTKTCLHIDGGTIFRRTTLSNAAYTVDAAGGFGDLYLGQIGTMSANRTITLPAAATVGAGRVLIVKDESNTVGANKLIVDANAAETIDGFATQELRSGRAAITIICDGTNWQMLSSTGTVVGV